MPCDSPAIEDTRALLVPTLSLYEVFKRVAQQQGENAALTAIALMQQGTLVELTAPLALSAATLSAAHKLPMADSIMYATAMAFQGFENSATNSRRPPSSC